jgi:hypothetical protein
MYPKKYKCFDKYDESVVEIVKQKLFSEKNTTDSLYWTNIINKINFIGDDAYNELQNEIIKILHETTQFNYIKNITELMSRIANKKINFHINHLKLRTIEYTPKKPTYYISKNGLSDAYICYKLKQVIEKNKPIFDDFNMIVNTMEKITLKDSDRTLKDSDQIFK